MMGLESRISAVSAFKINFCDLLMRSYCYKTLCFLIDISKKNSLEMQRRLRVCFKNSRVEENWQPLSYCETDLGVNDSP